MSSALIWFEKCLTTKMVFTEQVFRLKFISLVGTLFKKISVNATERN